MFYRLFLKNRNNIGNYLIADRIKYVTGALSAGIASLREYYPANNPLAVSKLHINHSLVVISSGKHGSPRTGSPTPYTAISCAANPSDGYFKYL